MKNLLLLALVCLQVISFGQITFEEITSPNDFNLSKIKQSPQGEYFVQAFNDPESIYTSMDAENWTKADLPADVILDDMQFFSDGTPLIKPDRFENLIRRNGVWYRMNISPVWGWVDASYIKGDSLFAFENNVFAYSLDKGVTFTEVFTYSPGVVAHSAKLWKFDNHFVLHHTAGASDRLSVFNMNGEQIMYEELDVTNPEITYSSCGKVLLNDDEKYYLLHEQDLTLETGNTVEIIPDFGYNSEMLTKGEAFYFKKENIIYKTNGCDFTWTVLEENEYIGASQDFWITEEEDIFLFSSYEDKYIEQISGTNVWEEKALDIDYAYVRKVNQTIYENQSALTSNSIFYKNVNDAEWIESDSTGYFGSTIQYAPNGDLYIDRGDDILYSEDNGNTFTTLELPETNDPGDYINMTVLGDGIIFFNRYLFNSSYYTLNNGQDWVEVNIPDSYGNPIVKLVGNHIYVAEVDYYYTVSRINITSNLVDTEDLGIFNNWFYYGSTLMDDGTLYFNGEDQNGSNPEGLYRFRFDEGLEYVGEFQQFQFGAFFESSGSDLYVFDSDLYYVFDGTLFLENELIGLPIGGRQYAVSEDEYLYVTVETNRIFRSVEPLSYRQFIEGSVFNNANEDCFVNASDDQLNFWQVKVESDDYLRIKNTDSQGNYIFSIPQGEYTVSSQPINIGWELCEAQFDVTIDDDNSTVNQDFLAKGILDCADLELDFSTPLLRRCFDNYYSIRIRNTGPEQSIATTLSIELDPFFVFNSASIPYTQIDDTHLEFDLGDLSVNEELIFKIYFGLSCDAELGMEHCLSGELTSDTNICVNSFSSYTECQENIGSYDPNDKRIFNEVGEEVEELGLDEFLYYHIRFQNTGTDTAFTVRVIDPLSSILDLSTLEMLSASHPYDFEITDGPSLEIVFDDILLPDSTTNEVESHGYFKFKIKPLPEFDYGTSIPNQASIYFDFNDPIITNEAILVLKNPTSAKEFYDLVDVKISPNPAQDIIEISISEDGVELFDSFEIFNLLGQSVASLSRASLTNTTFNIAHLDAGIYHLVLKENGMYVGVKKFVKM